MANSVKEKYTVVRSGFENPVKIKNSRGTVVAVIYTDKEPGDQYDTAEVIVDALNQVVQKSN